MHKRPALGWPDIDIVALLGKQWEPNTNAKKTLALAMPDWAWRKF